MYPPTKIRAVGCTTSFSLLTGINGSPSRNMGCSFPELLSAALNKEHVSFPETTAKFPLLWGGDLREWLWGEDTEITWGSQIEYKMSQVGSPVQQSLTWKVACRKFIRERSQHRESSWEGNKLMQREEQMVSLEASL